MRFLQSTWCPVCIGIISTLLILSSLLWSHSTKTKPIVKSLQTVYRENEEWLPPNEMEIPPGTEGDLIRYGKELISNTSKYIGPKGIVASLSNGMNCQNCHIDAGMQNHGNPFSSVSSLYPKYRERSGRIESIEYRVNECMQRSMNGQTLDSLSLEMRAFVAYITWVGHQVPKGLKPKGTGPGNIKLLERAADPEKGKIIYTLECARCHGENGQGIFVTDSTTYVYPPLWGNNSFNVSAGMYRLSSLAAFIKNNMPFGVTSKKPQLSDETAWDVAAFISAQQRPVLHFSYDWKDLSKKPFDHPFGPYADKFTETRHKYGPYKEIIRK